MESEPLPLPRVFSLKMKCAVMATPDEISKMLSDPEKRKQWDLNIETSKKAEKTLEINYTTCVGTTTLVHTFMQHEEAYIVKEVASRGQKVSQRIYLIEEVTNRPYNMRITFYQEQVTSATEGL